MMSINGINTQYQNYAASGTTGAKSSSGSSSFDAFQKEVVNWEKRIKDNIDKEKENDSNGSIQMSEKQWRNLIKRVDYAIDALKGNVKEQEQEGKKQVEEKNLTRKDTVAADSKTDNTPIQFLNRELVLR
ncbi:MAG TPA: hypothetical protein VHR42_07250 [Clostridia bacterium]|nr:hypothetical protein [Clostridia bacterium]